MTIREVFEAFMKANNVPLTAVDTAEGVPTHLGVRIGGENGEYESYAMCFEEESLFVFYSRLNLRVPEKKRERIAAKLMEINYSLKVGAFQMEPETGELTARVTHYMVGTDVEKGAQIERLVRVCGMIADQYYLEIAKILAE